MKAVMGLGLGLLSGGAYAVASCVSGCNQVVNQNFTQTLTSSQNQIGQSMPSNDVTIQERRIRYSLNGEKGAWGTYSGGMIPSPGSLPSTWVYRKIDDYISIALVINSLCRNHYLPYNARTLNVKDCQPLTGSGIISSVPASYQSRLRIDKKIVSGTYTRNILLGETGGCEPYGCRDKQVITAKIYANLNITVPQSCVINAGQVVTIDFGSISSGAFSTAGSPAQGVNPVTRNLMIKCDNIESTAALTIRLQANQTAQNAIVSNNPDVGFAVTDTSGKTLVPNNLNSVIPFWLNNNQANVNIRVHPVSITGKQPKEGPVTSEGYLRVDFP